MKKELRAILLYGIRRQPGDDDALIKDARTVERVAMICSEYRIKSVYHKYEAKATFLAVEESIYEIPLFGDGESIALRDEKVDAVWTDRLQRTMADLGLEWRTPSWHLEVLKSEAPHMDASGRLKPESLEKGLLSSLRQEYSDRMERADWFGNADVSGAGQYWHYPKLKKVTSAKGVGDMIWEVKVAKDPLNTNRYWVTAIDHPTLYLQKEFSVDLNKKGIRIEGPLLLPLDSKEGKLGEEEAILYAGKAVRRYLELATQLQKGVNLDHHPEWQALSKVFKEKK